MRAACEARVRAARAALRDKGRQCVRSALEGIIDDEQHSMLVCYGDDGGASCGEGGGEGVTAGGGGGGGVVVDDAHFGGAAGDAGGEWDEALEDALTVDERAELLAHLEAVLLEEEEELSQRRAELRNAEENEEIGYLIGLFEERL
jgi:hypothetical protein